MLVFYILALLMIGFPIHGGVIQDNDDDDIEDNSFSKKAEIYFQKRCLNDEKQLKQVLKELHQINECFKKILPTHTEEDEEGLRENCFEQRDEVMECMQKLVDLLEPCLPPEEKYLPEFILKSFAGFSKYLCEHIDVLTPDGLLETNMVKCINRFTRYKSSSPHYLCYESAKFGNHSHDAPILKEEVCEDLDFIYNCYERQFKIHCPDAPKAWEFEAGLLNGLRSPCNEERAEGEEEKEEGEEEKRK